MTLLHVARGRSVAVSKTYIIIIECAHTHTHTHMYVYIINIIIYIERMYMSVRLADSYSEQILEHLELEWNSSDITHLLLHFIAYTHCAASRKRPFCAHSCFSTRYNIAIQVLLETHRTINNTPLGRTCYILCSPIEARPSSVYIVQTNGWINKIIDRP